MLTNSYQLAQDFWEYIPAMTITDCRYFPLCLSYWCCPMISDDRRKFRSQISDNMDREEKKKEDQRRSKQRKSEERRSRCAQKGRKVAKHCFSNDLWLRMVESRLAKAAGAEPAGQMRDEKLHAVVARSACPSQNARNTPSLEHFLKLRCGKSARVVAQSTFPSQNVQNTPGSKHFWQLRCKVRAAVARRAFPSQNVQNPSCSEHFWKFRYRKKCTPLWRKARFQVKMLKALHVRSTFGGWDVERVHAAVARRTFPS